jgi:O-antigen/teichoic acid export membrane protein
MTKQKKVLINNISSLFSVEVANYVLPMISLPIIVRIIGPDKFGLINYAGAVVGYFMLIIDYGFNLTATRKVAQNKGDVKYLQDLFSTVFWCKIVFFCLSLIVFIACVATIPLFKEEWRLMFYTFIILISNVLTTNWLYQGMQELQRVAIFNIVVKIIFTVSILIVIRQPSDYIYQPLVSGIAQVGVGLYSFRYAMRRYNLKLIAVPFKRILNVVVEERVLFFSQIVIYLYTATNTVILGSISTTTQVGYYAAASRLIEIAQSIITLPLAHSFFPYVSTAFGKSKEEGLIAARKVLPVVSLISFTAFIGMITLGPTVLSIFFGSRFKSSIPIFTIMAIAPFLISVSNVYGIQIMLGLKMDKAFFRVTACGCIVSILANFMLVPVFGGIGSGLSLVITETFITTTFIIYLMRQNINILHLSDFRPGKYKTLYQSIISTFKR